MVFGIYIRYKHNSTFYVKHRIILFTYTVLETLKKNILVRNENNITYISKKLKNIISHITDGMPKKGT